jgi:transcriptional regulator with XRE-family HTH domain
MTSETPPSNLDYDRIARELLVALRGPRSQIAWSRRLGYSSNVAYPWESGRRFPTAAETLRAASRSGVDLRQALARFYGQPPAWLDETAPDSAEGIGRLLQDLRGTAHIVDLARRAGVSRFAVTRWLTGQTQPRLPDFLRIVEAASVRMVDFLAALVDPASLPSIASIWRRLEARRKGAGEHPWTQAIVRVLEIADYLALPAHEPGWIARRLGISAEEEATCLEFLRETGEVTWTGTRFRHEPIAVDTRRQPDVGRALKSHWTAVAGQRIREGRAGQYSYNVFTVSRADLERLRALHLAYFHNLRALVAESAPAEVVAVANVQLFALDGD